jgi:mannan endo-1,4-beta-mannosidase
MPYVQVAPGGRYFITEDGAPFLAIGHNEGMPWPGLANLHYERDIATTEATIAGLAAQGVTVLRIMLEYAQTNGWLFENPVGRPVPGTVLYWDDLIGLCERHGMRLLVLFWDTFFMSRRWRHHPYGRPGSGFDGPGSCLTSPTAMAAEKARIRFFLDRWGDSPAIFGYDLWNEIHPYWGGSPEEQSRWVTEMARFVKAYEM